MRNPRLYTTPITSLQENLPPLLDAAGLPNLIPSGKTILIKPNLVEALAPPVTTPVQLAALLVDYLQNRLPGNPILIGEGTGSLQYDTHYPFQMLGYTDLAAAKNIPLLDLNQEKLTKREDTRCKRWPIMYLPAILDEVFLLSVPVLKAHTLAGVTLTMKNMMGCAPPSHFRGQGGWGKSAFHRQIQEAIFDLNRYRTPDFTLLDASIGMAKAHLWGAHCEPPVNQLVASADPVAIDAYGAALLNIDWKNIGHIHMANSILGSAHTAPVEIP
ncbi:MAG: DUF362 domain-containing protein [Proteobacteria bacterium]|nr:DUF362 domain-containing protein [Pseudomonadota bacterium]MBU1060929.1 DUF362 domain-containing protein [Pseudomonadota bacterium]